MKNGLYKVTLKDNTKRIWEMINGTWHYSVGSVAKGSDIEKIKSVEGPYVFQGENCPTREGYYLVNGNKVLKWFQKCWHHPNSSSVYTDPVKSWKGPMLIEPLKEKTTVKTYTAVEKPKVTTEERIKKLLDSLKPRKQSLQPTKKIEPTKTDLYYCERPDKTGYITSNPDPKHVKQGPLYLMDPGVYQGCQPMKVGLYFINGVEWSIWEGQYWKNLNGRIILSNPTTFKGPYLCLD